MSLPWEQHENDMHCTGCEARWKVGKPSPCSCEAPEVREPEPEPEPWELPPDPTAKDNNGERIHSDEEVLQYLMEAPRALETMAAWTVTKIFSGEIGTRNGDTIKGLINSIYKMRQEDQEDKRLASLEDRVAKVEEDRGGE